jgi:hypothetical protein
MKGAEVEAVLREVADKVMEPAQHLGVVVAVEDDERGVSFVLELVHRSRVVLRTAGTLPPRVTRDEFVGDLTLTLEAGLRARREQPSGDVQVRFHRPASDLQGEEE